MSTHDLPTSLPSDVLHKVPAGLPVPQDDGACGHLPGQHLPRLALPSTEGTSIDLAAMPGWVVVYCYPMTGTPGRAIPDGWTEIPGAAGCTPQSCAFRDHHAELSRLGASVFGMSVQSTEDQSEAALRLALGYPLLSDSALQFASALRLPTFDAGGRRLLRRVTLIAHDGKIQTYFYPVFPPDRNAEDVVVWLRQAQATV